MIRENFTNLVNSIPNLVDTGIDSKMFCRQFKLDYPQSNASLLSDEGFNSFQQCVEWLQKNCVPTKTVSATSPDSRTLQQRAKKNEYVSNGAMIAAFIYLGYPYKVIADSPNVLVGVSRCSPGFTNG